MSSHVCSHTSHSLVKVDTVVPTAACHQSPVNQATVVTSMPTRSRLPLPVNQAAAVVSIPTRSRLPTQPRSLAPNLAATISDAVTARIQKRHQLTAAKFTAARRPQLPIKATRPVKGPVPATTPPPPSLPVGIPRLAPMHPPLIVERCAPLAPTTRKYIWVKVTFKSMFEDRRGHISHFVDIYDNSSLTTRIPFPPLTSSTNTGSRTHTVVAPARLRPMYLSMIRTSRGTSPYCGRYCRLDGDGKPFIPNEPYHTRHSVHADWSSECRVTEPRTWATTPAEEGPQSRCSHNKRVHWKPQVAEVVEIFEPWNLLAFGPTVKTDPIPPPEPLPPTPPPPPSPPSSPLPTEPEPARPANTNFHDTWTALMDEPFSDDLDY